MSALEDSLLGRRVRIISKAQIRYEGTLFSIRKDENNDLVLVLAKVTSFGTENRPCEHPIKPLDEVYEHIAFRGRELVDLQLIPQTPANDDPSIISVDIGPSSVAKPSSQGDGDGPSTSSLFPAEKTLSSLPNFLVQKPTDTTTTEIPFSPWNNLIKGENDNRVTGAVGPIRDNLNHTSEEPVSGEASLSGANVLNNAAQDRIDSHDRNRGTRQNQRNGSGNPNGGNSYSNNRLRGSGQHHNNGGNNRRNYNQRRRYDISNRSRQDVSAFKEEFDFDKSNAELAEFLEKLDVNASSNTGSEHGGDETNHEVAETYDSSKSFFDTLSSELMDQANGVVKTRSHREERRQNFDTFGPAANRFGGGYRGGGYRGRRGGRNNYHRGGGGGGGYRQGNSNYHRQNFSQV